jgi:hypothetical protein
MINFTEQHKTELQQLIFEAVTKRWQVATKLGMNLDVMDIFHTATIQTLRNIRKDLTNKLNSFEDDEWSDKSVQDDEKIEYYKMSIKLINLAIGYRLWKQEQYELESKKAALELKLNLLKEDQKTPEQKIAELEEELSKIELQS